MQRKLGLLLVIFYISCCKPILGQVVPEVYPTFALPNLKEFLEEKTFYPLEAFENNVKGKVFLDFIVTDSGFIQDVKVLKGLGFGCDESAIQALMCTNGNWNPAVVNGKFISFKQTIGIQFDPKMMVKTPPNSEVENGEEEFDLFDEGPEPQFDLYEYFRLNLRYPLEALNKEIQGKVFVRFVVSATGNIQKIEVVKGIGYGCDEEALRIVKNMPAWTPGKVNGKSVKTRVNIPINFKLATDIKSMEADRNLSSVENIISDHLDCKWLKKMASLDSIRFQMTCNGSGKFKKLICKENIQPPYQPDIEKLLSKLDFSPVLQSQFSPIGNDAFEKNFTLFPHRFKKCRLLEMKSKASQKIITPAAFKGTPDIETFLKESLVKQHPEYTGSAYGTILMDTLGNPTELLVYSKNSETIEKAVEEAVLATKGKWSPALTKKGKAFSLLEFYIPFGNVTPAVPPENNFTNFINRNVRIPAEAIQKKKEGDIGVRFRVDETGKTKDIEITKTCCCGWNEEIARLIRLSSGLWSPQLNNKLPSSSDHFMNFRFPLNPESR